MPARHSRKPHQHFWLSLDALCQDCPAGEAVCERVDEVLEGDFAGENRRYHHTDAWRNLLVRAAGGGSASVRVSRPTMLVRASVDAVRIRSAAQSCIVALCRQLRRKRVDFWGI
jgi:hypothetical protein